MGRGGSSHAERRRSSLAHPHAPIHEVTRATQKPSSQMLGGRANPQQRLSHTVCHAATRWPARLRKSHMRERSRCWVWPKGARASALIDRQLKPHVQRGGAALRPRCRSELRPKPTNMFHCHGRAGAGGGPTTPGRRPNGNYHHCQKPSKNRPNTF